MVIYTVSSAVALLNRCVQHRKPDNPIVKLIEYFAYNYDSINCINNNWLVLFPSYSAAYRPVYKFSLTLKFHEPYINSLSTIGSTYWILFFNECSNKSFLYEYPSNNKSFLNECNHVLNWVMIRYFISSNQGTPYYWKGFPSCDELWCPSPHSQLNTEIFTCMSSCLLKLLTVAMCVSASDMHQILVSGFLRGQLIFGFI